jgi:hypothetical protein
MKLHSLPSPAQEDHVPVNLKLTNIGPFEKADIDINLLTVFIGKNSVGKSFLAQVVWTLVTTMPEFTMLVSEAYGDMVKEFNHQDPLLLIYEKIRKGKDVSEDIRKLTGVLIRSFHVGLSEGLRKRIEEVFGSAKALIKRGAREARIRIQGSGRVEFIIKDGDSALSVNCVDYEPNFKFIDMLEIRIPSPRHLRVTLPDEEEAVYDGVVDSEEDIARTLISRLVYYYVKKSFNPFFYVWYTAMLPDSRAGISRILLKPYPHPQVIKGAMKVDEEFSDLFFDLSRAFHEQEIKVNLKDVLLDFLGELNCEVEVSREAGMPVIYLKMWNGEVIPYSEAPSGIREAVAPAIALASSKYGVVIIEEPEAHLHPRAQRLMARLLVRTINANMTFVIVTTHSDYLLSALSNHIMLSGKGGGVA